MKVMNIDTDCTDNGAGIRTTIYVSGCTHYCTGCQNPSSWNASNGQDYDIEKLIEIIEENSLADVTISGGDSLTCQYEDTLKLVKAIKQRTNKNIWFYTGYRFEEVLEEKKGILSYIDVIIDGRFDLSKKDLNLLFRGSANQRIIDVQRSIKEDNIIIWNDGHYF
jgi:anaerobic ribonucleoside-triphosphate reductase activating protein